MHYKTSPRNVLALLIALGGIQPLAAQISYVSGEISENFDTLSSTATNIAQSAFTDNVTIAGWYAASFETGYGGSGTFTFTMGTTENTATIDTVTAPVADGYTSSNGASTSGELYSFGANGSSERALGSLGSGTSDEIFIGMRIQNDTGAPMIRFTLSYDGEQWRRGANATQRAENMQVYYRVGGTDFVSNTGWVATPADLTFTTPNATDATASVLDGNTNKVTLTKEVVLSTPVPAGESLWIVWVDFDNVGTDHGLGIDNVKFSAVVSTGSDVSRGAGSTWTPSSFGGNAFTPADTAVFDGSASSVALSGNVEASALKFTTDGYVVTGTGSDSLAVDGAINVASGISATISGVLTGDSGLLKTGAGTLILSGVNTFVGSVTVNAGTISVNSDGAFGAAGNDINFEGTLVTSASSLSLGSGRTFSGLGGTIQTASSGTLSFAGPVAVGNLTISGPTTINFGGATNSVGTVSLAEPTAINVTGGALSLGGLALAQTSGTTTVTGPVSFSSGDKPFPVPGGTLVFNGAVTNGGTRLQKTGAGTLDLTSATVSGSGTLRIGVVSSDLVNQGGLVVIDEGSDLGTTQMHFNSGTLQATAPIISAAGVSIGGRRSYDAPAFASVLPVPTFTGSDITLSGASSFFTSPAAPASDQAIAVNVTNTTRLNGTFAVSTIGQWVMLGGGGTLVFGGNASALASNVLTADTITLQVDGQFGASLVEVSAGTTLTGSGTLTGWVTTTTTTTGTPPVTTTTVTYHSESNVWIRGGTLEPTGLLTVNAGLTLAGTTELDIAGLTRGTEYDSVALINPDAAGSVSFTLSYGGDLKLNFPATALNGTYTLFEIGASNVSRTGSFSSVELTGLYSGSLGNSGGVWSGADGSTSFSFNESTGVLTVTGGGSPTTALEDWKIEKFGTATDTPEILVGNTEDFDGDGLSNLLEYAFDTDPTVAGSSPVVASRSGNVLTLTYPRITDASLTYTVLGSGDLTAGFGATTGVTETTGGLSTYTDTVDLSAPGVRRFLRVSVTYTE